jgi:M6 family metalloprotease-like protein
MVDHNRTCHISQSALLHRLFSLILLIPLVLPVIARAQSPAAQSTSQALEDLTLKLLDLNAQYRSADESEKSQLLNEIQSTVASRQELLSTLIEENPGEVLRASLPAKLRASLPAATQNLVERETDATGRLEVIVEDRKPESELHYFLNADGQRFSLHFAKNPPINLVTDSVVHVHGVQVGGGLALTSGSDSSSVTNVSAGPLTNTFGAQNTLVILVNFQDNASQPYTLATAQSVVFTTASNFWMENSFQQTWLTGDVAGWYTLPLSSTTCNTSSIETYAQQAAKSAGYVLSNYNHFVYAFPQTSACAWWGWSNIGGTPSNSWINGNLQLQVVDHELGHGLGLYHSHGLNCSGMVYAASGCPQYEYGDYYDIMASSTAMHYNAFQKERLGWLNYSMQPPITTVTSTGTYTIAPYETQDNNPKALKILQSSSSGTYYYLEFRQPIGFDNTAAFTNSYGYSNAIEGVVVDIASPSNANSSDLLNMNPSSSWDYAMALDVGESYTDSTAGVTIAPTAVSSTGATVQVTFGSGSCTHANPTVSVSPSQSQYVTPGTAVSFTVTVKDSDNSVCSTSSFDLNSSIPTGWSGTWNSSALALTPGGSGSAILTVTSPSGDANGFYAIGVSATNASATTYAASGAATYVVSTATPTTVTVSVSTNQSSYLPGQTVSVIGSVLANGSADAGTSVTASIIGPNGKATTLTGTTGANGAFSLSYKLAKRASVGTYQTNAVASGTSASTTFTVQ